MTSNSINLEEGVVGNEALHEPEETSKSATIAAQSRAQTELKYPQRERKTPLWFKINALTTVHDGNDPSGSMALNGK